MIFNPINLFWNTFVIIFIHLKYSVILQSPGIVAEPKLQFKTIKQSI